MADITYIPIRQLYPHPDNPRKELGDLSELAASIKENGVYQNLTVIPGHYLNSREYIAKCVDEGGDSSREGYWSTEWNGPTDASKFVHRKNDDLDSTYELLAALGYEMADDEKALQDGTHQLFAVYGSGSQADTPCDKCKAAHPECDKCCKTCDDHCNAFQLCRKEYGE